MQAYMIDNDIQLTMVCNEAQIVWLCKGLRHAREAEPEETCPQWNSLHI